MKEEKKVLFPVVEVPSLQVSKQSQKQKYRKSVFWDIEKGDFARDGTNRMIASDGKDTYMQWCYKVARTERFAFLSYPNYIGVELEDAMKQQTSKAVESSIERTISEALLVNTCTQYVRQFTFQWEGDHVFCECMVKAINWDEFKLQVSIGMGEGR